MRNENVMNFRLDEKAALITGAGRGIGLGIARALAAHGCAVAIQDIDLATAKKEAKEIVRVGGNAIALAGDIGDFAWPKKWVAATQKELGGLHILINNASIQMEKRWEDLSPEEIRKQWDANWIAPLLLCQLAAPIFRRQNWGRIINIGSIQQRQGNPVMTAYSATKAALENLTTGLAADLAKDGITANTIAPGFFNTYRNRHMFKNGKPIRDHSDWIPAGRVGEPRDAGGIALLLCSEEGSYITGQTIFVDGGLSVR